MEKRIVGSFNSDEEVLYAIEGLKRQGHRETDMMVVAESTSAIPLVTSRTGVMVEADQQMRTLTGVMMNSIYPCCLQEWAAHRLMPCPVG